MVSGLLASIRAPLVQNGLTSTMVELTASAATKRPAEMPPSATSGIAIGMITGSSAVDEANAETTPPT